MDQQPTTVRVPSPARGLPSAIVLVAIGLVVFATLKPWGIGGAGPTVPASSRAPGDIPAGATASSSTPAGPDIWDPNAMACMSSEGDRLLALQRTADEEVRTWLVLGDTALSDPLDPAAVPLRLPSSHVIGLGVCARRVVQASELSSAAQVVDVETVAVGGGSARDLGAPCVITRQLGIPYLGVLYGPPPSLAGGTCPVIEASSPPDAGSPVPSQRPPTTWPIGSYTFGFRFSGDASSVTRWLRLDIVAAVGKYD